MKKNEITEEELKELEELTKFMTEPEGESTSSGSPAEEDDLEALLAELEGEVPDSVAAGAPSQTKEPEPEPAFQEPEPPVEDKPEPPAEDEPVKPQDTDLEDELMTELGGVLDFGAAYEQKPEPPVEEVPESPVEDEPEPPTEEQFTEPAGAPAGQDELDDLLAELEGETQEPVAVKEPEPELPFVDQSEPPVEDESPTDPGDSISALGTGEEPYRPEEGPSEPQPTPPPTPVGRKKGRKLVIIGIVAVLCLCAIGFGAWQMFSHKLPPGEEQASQPATTEQAEAEPATEPEETTEPSEPQNKDNEETASVTENADKMLHIPSWDLDFSNSTVKNDDGTLSFDNIMLVHNDSDKDITGFAYNVKNSKGDLAKNKDSNVKEGSPFYAEGFVPAGESGIMVSKMTVTKDEYDLDKEHRLKHRNQKAKAEDNDVEITEVYLFKGKDGYKQATGKLDGSYKDGKHSIYVAKIDNNGNTTVHNGAKIVAVKIVDKDGHDSIKVSSAKGAVDRDIEAGSTGVVIGNAFKDPGLGDSPAKDYQLYVIDNKYEDGSTYTDAYLEKYAK